jgi:hypothetical protein
VVVATRRGIGSRNRGLSCVRHGLFGRHRAWGCVCAVGGRAAAQAFGECGSGLLRLWARMGVGGADKQTAWATAGKLTARRKPASSSKVRICSRWVPGQVVSVWKVGDLQVFLGGWATMEKS